MDISIIEVILVILCVAVGWYLRGWWDARNLQITKPKSKLPLVRLDKLGLIAVLVVLYLTRNLDQFLGGRPVDGQRLQVVTPWRVMPNWPEKGMQRALLTFERAK